ncbi:heat shock cognate 71 kDa protein-like isoform X1 [Rhynchophorus ferrugineus]|uniref:heat shock cognate 71 kDa protein-like isoform X1 n=1 Tax=Rhynchophorus ferrugineus TaxID=354439 RepID=UPI003FCE42AC
MSHFKAGASAKSKPPAIGIDLGTSFSAAAVFLDGKPEAIRNKEGQRTTPSYIFYNERNSNIWVGSAADNQGISCITNFLFDVKRIIGRKYNDDYVQLIKNSEDHHFIITSDSDGNAVFEVKHNGMHMKKWPEDVSSEVMKYLKNSASEYLNAEDMDAVISVPAHFNQAQRRATEKAAELAGFNVLKLITEPVAGALYYLRENPHVCGKVLVYDFGGGTFDVTVIDVNKNQYEIMNREGDIFLGGRDMDKLVVDYFKGKLIEEYGEQILTPKLRRRLLNKCTVLKERLSIQEEYSIVLECIDGNEHDFTISMTRTKYEQIISALIDKSMDIVKKCLTKTGITPEDITNVVLIGSVTRTPKIRQRVSEYFGANKIKTDINPDEAVALGAAYQAVLLTQSEFRDIENITISEVSPFSLGVDVTKGLVRKIIEKGSRLPARNDIEFLTLHNGQSAMGFKIYEGERKNAIHNNYVGEFICRNLPKRKAGEVKVKVTFILDYNRILRVEANVFSLGETTKLSSIVQEYPLCQHVVTSNIGDAEKNKADDDLFEFFVNIYCSIKTLIHHVLYNLEDLHSDIDKRYIKQKCSILESYMEKINHNTPFNEILDMFLAFEKINGPMKDFHLDFEKPYQRLKRAIEKVQ